MDWATVSAAWRQAYERAFADAKALPLLIRLTPVTVFYVVYSSSVKTRKGVERALAQRT